MLLRQFPDFNRPINFKTLRRIGNESELLFGMKQSDGMTKLKHFTTMAYLSNANEAISVFGDETYSKLMSPN